MRLSDYLTGMKRLIQDGEGVDLGLSEEVALLYRGFVQNHYLDILPKVYSRLDECYPCPWEDWRDGYYKQYPPHAWELNHLAKYFPDYLESNQLLEQCLVELALYEWTEYSISTQLANGCGATALRGQYYLNPVHQLLELGFDVAGWIFHWERENEGCPLEGRPMAMPNVLIVSRNVKTLGCVMTQCDLLDLMIYEVLSERVQSQKELLTSCIDASSRTEFQFTEQQFREKIVFLEQQSILIQE